MKAKEVREMTEQELEKRPRSLRENFSTSCFNLLRTVG